jgi:hypothetical protein
MGLGLLDRKGSFALSNGDFRLMETRRDGCYPGNHENVR